MTDRNPIYVERPRARAARKIWDALAAAGFRKINLWFEDIGDKVATCGPVGGWSFQDESGAGEWLGYDWEEAVGKILQNGMKREPELMYRYEDVAYSSLPDPETGEARGPGTLKVELRIYRIVRRTERGAWIVLCDQRAQQGSLGYNLVGHDRFVLSSARKRFACPTVAEARTSFIARKRRQAGIHKARMERALRAIEMVNESNPLLDAAKAIGIDVVEATDRAMAQLVREGKPK